MTYEDDDAVLSAALQIAERRLTYTGYILTSPQVVSDYLRVWASRLTEEAFGVMWLTNAHELVHTEVLATGSIDSASVHPRVVVRAGIAHNAAACLVFHNHPSGNPDPSRGDIALTKRLKEVLAMVDIQLLDHFVVGRTIVSLAEQGLV